MDTESLYNADDSMKSLGSR